MADQCPALPSTPSTSQDPPGPDPGGDFRGKDQPHPLPGRRHREPVREDQQPRAHRHPGVHRLLLFRQPGQAGVQRGYGTTAHICVSLRSTTVSDRSLDYEGLNPPPL